MNRRAPIANGSSWSFISQDADRQLDEISYSHLVQYTFTVDTNDHVIFWVNYFAKASEHPEFNNGGENSFNYNGELYYMFWPFLYEGTCFVDITGNVTIEMKCYNDFGSYVNDEIVFSRTDDNTLVLKSHTGNEFKLKKGDTFRR